MLGPGEVVNCTFTNVDRRQARSCSRRRSTRPEGAGDQVFGFVSPCGGHAIVEGQTGECTVPAGTYDVVEEEPGPNFALGSIECDDDDSSGELATRTATSCSVPGEVVNCASANVDQRGTDRVHEGGLEPRHQRPGLRLRLALQSPRDRREGQTEECTVPAGTYDVVEDAAQLRARLDRMRRRRLQR